MKIVLQNLTKIFPSRNKKSGEEVVAVNNFDFTIPDGKLIGLLGPSGCGKSTTLYMISGLQKPSSGKIFFGEDDVTDLSTENRGIGLVFQNYALYPHLTVKQNNLFPHYSVIKNVTDAPISVQKRPRAEAFERGRELLAKMGLADKEDMVPCELSGGQQQRVAIARALVKMPRVLLLDEPLSNLDARLRLQTREEIRRIQKETKITTVFVTHDQEEAMSISDMIVVMKFGVVQQIGKPQDVYDNPANLFVANFLGTPPINIFTGHVKGERLFIGADNVMDVPGVKDQDVFVGIRPEGFILDMANGTLCCKPQNVEVMGRDVSVVSTHEASQKPMVRSIIDADNKVDASADVVRYRIKPHKIFLFTRDDEGVRIPFEVK